MQLWDITPVMTNWSASFPVATRAWESTRRPLVVLIRLIAGTDSKVLGKQIAAWIIAALAKFAVLYLLVVKIICGLAAAPLLAAGTLKEPMLKMLPAMFAWPQLVTALIGGAIALILVPVLRKALHR